MDVPLTGGYLFDSERFDGLLYTGMEKTFDFQWDC